MTPLHSFALAIALCGLLVLPARAGDDGPTLPCGAAALPTYAEPGQPPDGAGLARQGGSALGARRPAPAGPRSDADILVAVAGSFKHGGDIDDLLARIGAISSRRARCATGPPPRRPGSRWSPKPSR